MVDQGGSQHILSRQYFSSIDMRHSICWFYGTVYTDMRHSICWFYGIVYTDMRHSICWFYGTVYTDMMITVVLKETYNIN